MSLFEAYAPPWPITVGRANHFPSERPGRSRAKTPRPRPTPRAVRSSLIIRSSSGEPMLLADGGEDGTGRALPGPSTAMGTQPPGADRVASEAGSGQDESPDEAGTDGGPDAAMPEAAAARSPNRRNSVSSFLRTRRSGPSEPSRSMSRNASNGTGPKNPPSGSSRSQSMPSSGTSRAARHGPPGGETSSSGPTRPSPAHRRRSVSEIGPKTRPEPFLSCHRPASLIDTSQSVQPDAPACRMDTLRVPATRTGTALPFPIRGIYRAYRPESRAELRRTKIAFQRIVRRRERIPAITCGRIRIQAPQIESAIQIARGGPRTFPEPRQGRGMETHTSYHQSG